MSNKNKSSRYNRLATDITLSEFFLQKFGGGVLGNSRNSNIERKKIFDKGISHYILDNITIILLGIIYIFSIGETPILGDSIVFTVIGNKGFDLATNATNHFLYINFLALVHKILPFVDTHYLFVGISILSSLVSLYFIKKTMMLLGVNRQVANIMVLFTGLSFTFWRVSIITEVYAFYLMFFCIFLHQLISFNKTHQNKNFYAMAITLGIMLLIHIQTILLVPLYLFVLWSKRKEIGKNIIAGVVIPLLFFLILVVPVLFNKHSFMAIFTDDMWGTRGVKAYEFIKSIARNIGFLLYNFLLFLIPLFLGIKKRKYSLYFVIALIPYLIFILKHSVSDSYVFHLVPYMFFIMIIGLELDNVQYRKYYKLIYFGTLLFPLAYLLSYSIVEKTTFGNQIEEKKGFKGGVRYLFFPPIKGNPNLETFIEEYQKGKIPFDSDEEKKNFGKQYDYAVEWEKMK